MTQTPSILRDYARTNTAWLHARGQVATQYLISKMEVGKGDKILEIGIGTGATLVMMQTSFPAAFFYGADVSADMLSKAQARLRWCGLSKKCSLVQLVPQKPLPYPDGFFQVVYLESVLGIQEGGGFEFLFSEISRVLAPGGRLYLNETIWLESSTPAERAKINAACKNSFGIIQANADYPCIADWIEIMKRMGLRPILQETLAHLPVKAPWSWKEWVCFRSDLFTLAGRIRAKISPASRSIFDEYSQQGKAIFDGRSYMTGYLIIAEKKTI